MSKNNPGLFRLSGNNTVILTQANLFVVNNKRYHWGSWYMNTHTHMLM